MTGIEQLYPVECGPCQKSASLLACGETRASNDATN